MSDTGWVFVTHASLIDLHCDLVLIPTDASGSVRRQWGAYAPMPDVRRWRHRMPGASPVSERFTFPDKVDARYVDVGAFPSNRDIPAAEAAGGLEWLTANVRAGLDAAGRDARSYRGRRERPLVAMPVFGTGAGGFDQIRGQVLTMLLNEAQAAVDRHRMDVVIACYSRADLTALQHHRRPARRQLADRFYQRAVQLGQAAAGGSLAVFLGAGASAASGLPLFAELIVKAARLEPAVPLTSVPVDQSSAAIAAGELEAAVGETDLKRRIREILRPSRHSLLHGLLAALRVDGVMTTNFDTLFELSAQQSYADGLRVLPGGRQVQHHPWLLKLHGDINGPGSLIVTSEQLAAASSAMASVAAAALLTREVLFVGYSCLDPDFLKFAADVSEVVPAGQSIGAVLCLEPMDETVTSRLPRLELIDVHADGSTQVTPASARSGEIFCDVLAWEATRDEPGWLLDPRYRHLGSDRQTRDELASMPLPVGDEWSSFRRVLRHLGYTPAEGQATTADGRPPSDIRATDH